MSQSRCCSIYLLHQNAGLVHSQQSTIKMFSFVTARLHMATDTPRGIHNNGRNRIYYSENVITQEKGQYSDNASIAMLVLVSHKFIFGLM